VTGVQNVCSSDLTLPQLMADRDAQKILNESKYRPKNAEE
jgi:hypothetical protein